MSTLPTIVDSQEVRQIARGESFLYSAWFGNVLRDSDTLASVTSVTQTDEPEQGTDESNSMTIGSGAINTSGAVTVDGVSRAVNTVIQFRVTAKSNQTLGAYVVTVQGQTAGSDAPLIRCRFVVV